MIHFVIVFEFIYAICYLTTAYLLYLSRLKKYLKICIRGTDSNKYLIQRTYEYCPKILSNKNYNRKPYCTNRKSLFKIKTNIHLLHVKKSLSHLNRIVLHNNYSLQCILSYSFGSCKILCNPTCTHKTKILK